MHAYRDQYAQLFHDGRSVVLIGISTDPVEALASWSKDDEFPFLFASDSGGVLGKTYGAHNPKFGLDNRNLFVVGPDGKIASSCSAPAPVYVTFPALSSRTMYDVVGA